MAAGASGRAWIQSLLGALRAANADRIGDLPGAAQARLYEEAAEVWPAVGRLYLGLAKSLLELPPGERPRSRKAEESVASQLRPELDISGDEWAEVTRFRSARDEAERLRGLDSRA